MQTGRTGDFVGFVGLAPDRLSPATRPQVEVGWRLRRDAWGRGYATEAGRAALDHAFTALGLDEVVSVTTAGNERSRTVMRRLGLRTLLQVRGHPAMQDLGWHDSQA